MISLAENLQTLSAEHILDNCPFGIGVISKGIIIEVNSLFCSMLKHSKEELVNKTFKQFVHKNDISKVSIIEQLKASDVSIRIVSKEGESNWFDIKTSAHRSEPDVIIFYLSPSKNELKEDQFEVLMASVVEADESTLFEKTVLNLTKILGVHYAFIGMYDAESDEITIRSMSINDELQSPFSYSVKDTPCGDVVRFGRLCVASETQGAYPLDHYLVDWNVHSYVGVSLKNEKGESIGHLAIMDTKPLENTAIITSLLEMFSYRLGIAMDREIEKEELEYRDERYRRLFNSSLEAKLVYNRRTDRIIDVNGAACEMFKFSKEEFKHLGMGDIKPRTLGDGTLTADQVSRNLRHVDAGEMVQVETLSRKSNGIIFETEVSLVSLDKKNDQILVSYRDISYAKKVHKALMISEKRFRSLFENSFDAIFLYNIEKDQFENCNDRAIDLFKYDREQMLKMSQVDIVAPVQRNFVKSEDAVKTQMKILSKNQRLHFDFDFRKSDGTVFECEVSLLPIIDEVNKYCITVIKDVSDRKQYEDSLREREEFLRKIIDLNPNLVFGKDKDRRFTIANRATANFLGLEPEQLIGKTWDEICTDKEEAKRILASDNQVLKTKERVDIPVEQLTCHETKTWWMQTAKMPILNERGEVEVILNVSTDISSHINMENRLQESNTELKRLNSELDHFVYKASHDLRAPLASILGLTNLIKTETSMEQVKQCNDFIDDQIKKLDGFIKEIIDYSRVSRTDLQLATIDIKQSIEEIFDSLKYLSKSSSIRKEVTVEGNSPLFTDTRSLDIVLKNLLSNAIKYSNDERDDSFVRCEVQVNEQEATITVHDNGIGIDKDYLPKIFDMFYQATERSDGSGLGLFIVKQCVDKLSGEIKVDSELGEGSEFNIVIPNHYLG